VLRSEVSRRVRQENVSSASALTRGLHGSSAIDIPAVVFFIIDGLRHLWEVKSVGLVPIYVCAFFKFAWAISAGS